MAVVVPVMVAMVTVPRHSEHTPNAPDDATSHTTDDATNHPGNHYKSDFHGQHSIIQHSPDEFCNRSDDNRRRVSRLCLGQFRRKRLAFAVAGPCDGRKAAATAVAPVRPEVKILVERLSA